MQCVTPADHSSWYCRSIRMKWRADHIHCASHACQMMADHFVLGLTWSVGLSLRRHSVCPTLSVSSLCVTSSPCPTSSTCPQSACLCVFVSLLLLFFCSLCPSPCSSVVRALLYVLVGVFLFSQLVWRSATSHIRRELVVSRLNWSARSDQLFTNRQTTCIATPGCHVAGAMWWNALPMHFPWQQRVGFF